MDFLAIGDIVVDAFIKLKDATVHCNINNEDCTISMRWGDKIPFEFAEIVPGVGNCANAAVAASRLGLSSGLLSNVGDDSHGQDCIAAMMRDKVDTTFISVHKNKKTNYHYVLWYENQRTILVKHEEFDYALPATATPPKWVYLTSLSQTSGPFHHQLMQLFKQWPETKLAFQPGTFQMKLGKEELADVYQRTYIFFCNKEESERILGLPVGTDIKTLLTSMQALGPKIVVITDDERGAYGLDQTGAMYFVPTYPDPTPVYEITGAGDAFASSTAVALALGLPFEQALLWGPVNAGAVIRQVGAQKGLLTRAELEKRLANPPGAFAVQKI